MATREEKLKLVEELKTQIIAVRTEIEEVKQTQKRLRKSGTLMRTGIVLLLVAVGLACVAYFVM